MRLRILSGVRNRTLARSIAAALDTSASEVAVERFPDGECRPRVTVEEGDDVYLVHSTGPPVAESVVQLLLAADACRRAGAARLTAVVPYFGYARQDRRGVPGEALGSRVMADVLRAVGVDRLVVVDPHTPALEAIAGIPTVTVTAVPVLADAVAARATEAPRVVVAPDLGAAKLARRFGDRLDLPVAVVHKTRVSGVAVEADDVVGEVAGRAPLVVDDMIATGATIVAAVDAVVSRGARPEVTVAATHALLVGGAGDRLAPLPLEHVVVTDSVAPAEARALPLEVYSLAGPLARAVAQLRGAEGTAGPGAHGASGAGAES